MKRFFSLVVGIILTTMAFFANAQDNLTGSTPKYSSNEGFYFGGSASTNGWGFDARYAFNNWFSLKTGYETLSFTYSFDFDENGIDYGADLDYKTGGVLLLADFNYTKNLYISAGVVFNSFNPVVDGRATDSYQLGDITIPAEDIGTFNIEMEPGIKVAPYIGAGSRAYIGRAERLTFNFEIGLYYMGAPEIAIESEGLLAPTSDPALAHAEYLSDQFSAYKIYPVIKLNLAYLIF